MMALVHTHTIGVCLRWRQAIAKQLYEQSDTTRRANNGVGTNCHCHVLFSLSRSRYRCLSEIPGPFIFTLHSIELCSGRESEGDGGGRWVSEPVCE